MCHNTATIKKIRKTAEHKLATTSQPGFVGEHDRQQVTRSLPTDHRWLLDPCRNGTRNGLNAPGQNELNKYTYVFAGQDILSCPGFWRTAFCLGACCPGCVQSITRLIMQSQTSNLRHWFNTHTAHTHTHTCVKNRRHKTEHCSCETGSLSVGKTKSSFSTNTYYDLWPHVSLQHRRGFIAHIRF